MFQKGFAKIFILYMIAGIVILVGALYAVKNSPAGGLVSGEQKRATDPYGP